MLEVPPPPPSALPPGHAAWGIGGAGLMSMSSLRPAVAVGTPDSLGGMVPIVPAGTPIQIPPPPPAPLFHPGMMMGIPPPPPPPQFIHSNSLAIGMQPPISYPNQANFPRPSFPT